MWRQDIHDSRSTAETEQTVVFFAGGKDFIYKPAATGYILYSVGGNLTDDGGMDRDHGGDDLVVEAK
ncbi:MAG: hypothetical protein ACE15C_09835 [Phycisphaerae bacterium]